MENLSKSELKNISGGDLLAYYEALGDAINAMNNATPGSTSWNDSLWLRNTLLVEI
ncbi:bacteriocin-type signal sequence-containing protein [Marivirga sericea]|uniref:Bacteriocin-type signal sequence-containing protein n=1 Tax=Marivirga sericea TaxID=1028 RepID=A0A1X7JA29_9BACT|nr:bacteriocin [Marivirga sericea]SMG24671.1 bacteriocin-type signal sequence-containing protein [Marivirga sericea]